MNHPKVDTELLQQMLAAQLRTNELLRTLITQAGQLNKALFQPLSSLDKIVAPPVWEVTST